MPNLHNIFVKQDSDFIQYIYKLNVHYIFDWTIISIKSCAELVFFKSFINN